MTEAEKYKAAFRALLRKYQNDIDVEFGDEANNFCTRCCPFASAPDKKDCPAVICEEYHDSDYDEFDIDEDKCAEEIFKFYGA